MQYLLLFFKKIVLSICIIYAVNITIYTKGIIIPINVVSVLVVSILGTPSIIGIAILQKLL